MDLRKEIHKEHSKAQALKVVDYVGDNPSRFNALVKVYLAGPYRITQRAAWPISICIERHPSLLKPHLKSLLDFLEKPGIHNAVKRNTMRMLQFITIPKRYQGRVVERCVHYLQNKKEAVAIKIFALTVLSHIVKEEPALKKELILLIEDYLPYATAGFHARVRKILKELQ